MTSSVKLFALAITTTLDSTLGSPYKENTETSEIVPASHGRACRCMLLDPFHEQTVFDVEIHSASPNHQMREKLRDMPEEPRRHISSELGRIAFGVKSSGTMTRHRHSMEE
ncbi:hypothetical protein IWZ03DRAFT_375286 [Phyllosticta citriasiana]|uniref:Secreted protein n=1 Tax=Phyllosticta citriasiana TaxID=595635 RepID=A0ABR1KRN8_9PEZI